MFRHQFIERRSYLAISIILVGLLLLALSSTPERAHSISHTLRWLIIISPLPIAAVGVFLARAKNHKSTIGLAALSGIAFGSTSIIGRIFSFSKPAWHTVYSPLVIAIIASGILGILLFSTALQRLNATAVNATMTASQTLVPAVVGIVFLGDHPRNGLWDVVVLGGLLTLGGVLVLSIKGHQEKPEKTRV
jgi:hypothetical membrane protein